MSIRILDEEERLDALNLIREVFFSMGNLGMNRQAAQSFLEFLSLEAQDLVYLGYYAGDLTGTIALSPEGDTVHLLFVRKERQRQGIGTALWQEACRRGSSEGIERFTVKALKGSEGFYRKNGFEAYGEESVSRGMKYLPMEYLAGREDLIGWNKHCLVPPEKKSYIPAEERDRRERKKAQSAEKRPAKTEKRAEKPVKKAEKRPAKGKRK